MKKLDLNVPGNWKLVKLGDICEFKYGKSLPNQNRINGSVPVFGSNGIIGFHNEAYTKAGTIIIGRKGSIGEISLSDQPCWPIDTTYYVEPQKELINNWWLFYILKSLDFKGQNKGTAIPGLNREDAYKITIVLPPLEEQQQIAAVLDEKMAAIDVARSAAEKEIETLNQLMTALIEKSLKTETKELSLSDCFVETKKGIGPTWKNYPLYGATRSGLAPAKEKVGKQPERYKFVNQGTILYNPMRINIGSVAIIGFEDKPGITSPDYVVINAIDGVIDPFWFYYWLRSYYGEYFIQTLARGAVRERMLFNRLAVGRIKIPSFEIQKSTTEKINQISSAKRKINEQLELINKLPQAYLGQAFRGEL